MACACTSLLLLAAACSPAPIPTPTTAPAPSHTPAATLTSTPAPDQPAPGYVLDLLLTVLGYRQDGTAEVEVSVSVGSEGGGPVEEVPLVAVECRTDGAPADGCGGPVDGLVPDRFGPAEATVPMLAPMGAELRAVLEDGTASNTVVVPERILGIERDVWDCFSDRPRREVTYENDFLAGCGGWTSATVLKWVYDEPVRVWADPSGDPRYVRALEATLDGLGPLLNLDFEWVKTEEEATLRAYVGVPSTRAGSIGLDAFCQDATGCAEPDSYEDGTITSASMSVWLAPRTEAPFTENEIAHVTLHEALHALAAMHHRPAADSVMSVNAALRLPSLSDSDKALLRLHAHPLVRPGMTIPEIERLIVFADELLDPPAVGSRGNGIQLAERAYDALLEAGSARFDVRGGWPGPDCGQTFSGSHALGRFARGYPGIVHFDTGDGGFLLARSDATGWTGWRRDGAQWEQEGLARVYEATGWRAVFTDPAEMLLDVIAYAGPGDVRVAQLPGAVGLDATLTDPRVFEADWVRGVTLRVSATLDAQTHRISAYEMRWEFDALDEGACSRYEVEASNAEYGVDVPLPPGMSSR